MGDIEHGEWLKTLLHTTCRMLFLATILPAVFHLGDTHAQYHRLLYGNPPSIEGIVSFQDTLYAWGDTEPFQFSADNGQTWLVYPSWMNVPHVDVLELAVTDTLMYLGTSMGLFRKSVFEGGIRWVSTIRANAMHVQGNTVHLERKYEPTQYQPRDTTILYVSHEGGYGMKPYAHPGKHAHIVFLEDSSIYLLTDEDKNYFTSDLGRTWEERMKYAPNALSDIVRFNGVLYGVPSDRANYLYKSTDGLYWWQKDAPWSFGVGTRLQFERNTMCMWQGNSAVYLYDSTTNDWVWTYPELSGRRFVTFIGDSILTANTALHLCARPDDLLRLRTGNTFGHPWALNATENAVFLRMGMASTEYVSNDRGERWWIERSYAEGSRTVELNGLLYSVAGNSLLVSSDTGLHWSEHRTLSVNCFQIALDGSRFVVATNGSYEDTTYIMHSNDTGRTWINEGGFIDDQQVRLMDVRDDCRLVLTKQYGPVYHWHYTSDAGEHWFELNITLQAPIVNIVLADDRIFAQTTYGLWVSTDHGQVWTGVVAPKEEFELLFAVPGYVVASGPDGYIFFPVDGSPAIVIPYPLRYAYKPEETVTNGKVIYVLQNDNLFVLHLDDDLLSARTSDAVSTSLEITGISPMPVQGIGLLHYTSSHYEYATLTVHDILGRIVMEERVLELRPVHATLPLPCDALPPGTYVARLRTASAVLTQSFTVR